MGERKGKQDKREVELKPPRGYTEEEWAREREEFRKWYFQEVKKYKEALQKGEIKETEEDRRLSVLASYIWYMPGITAKQACEMIERYNRGEANDWERFVVRSIQGTIRRYRDREAWEMFFHGKFPERGL